ncbi:MAG: hypothetical protein Q9210_006449 [Variospora velana]
MPSLLLVVFILQILIHLVNTVGAQAINDLVTSVFYSPSPYPHAPGKLLTGVATCAQQLWTLYNKLPTSTRDSVLESNKLRDKVLLLKRELMATSSQDEFAKWAKLRRQHDKAVAQYEEKANSLKSFQSSFTQATTVLRWLGTNGLRFMLQFWFARRPMFWIPRGWLPGYVEFLMAFPRAPRGSVSIQIWGIACATVVQMVGAAVAAGWILVREKKVTGKAKMGMQADSRAARGEKKEFLKTLLFTLGPLLLPKLIGYYRAYRAKARSEPVPVRPLPPYVFTALNILSVSCLFALISTLPNFAPENIFQVTSSRLQTPNDVLFTRLSYLRPDNKLTQVDELLKPRIASIDARCLYLYYGPSIVAYCPFCLSDEPMSYFWYAVPMILFPHMLHLVALGAATSSAIGGKEGNRWRTSAVMLGVGLAVSECYVTGASDFKANARVVRAEDLNHFHWNMRIWRGIGIAVADATLAGFLWASSTNRLFVVPPTAAERMETATRVLENARGRMAALGIIRNVVLRDEGLRRKTEGYWRKEGQVMSEVMDEREVVEGMRSALGSGRVNISQVEEDARRFADGLVISPSGVQQQPL